MRFPHRNPSPHGNHLLLSRHHWIVFNFLKELRSAPKCVPNVPLEGQGGLRFPPNPLWIAQLLLFLRKKESHPKVPNPKSQLSCLGWICALPQLCFLIFRVNSPSLPAWAGLIPFLSPKFLPRSAWLQSHSLISGSISNLPLGLEVFSWNFESIPPFSL